MLLQPREWLLGSAVCIACLLPAGCGKPDLDKMVDQGMQQVSERMEGIQESAQKVRSRVEQQVTDKLDQAQDAVGQQVGRARDTVSAQVGQGGSVRLEVEPPLELDLCFAEFLRFSDGRPSVLQFQTYRGEDSETFPSVFVRSVTTATSLPELAGTTLEAEVFVQREAGGEVLYTPAPAQLEISQIGERQIVARILGGTLRRTGSDETLPLRGQLEGRLDR